VGPRVKAKTRSENLALSSGCRQYGVPLGGYCFESASVAALAEIPPMFHFDLTPLRRLFMLAMLVGCTAALRAEPASGVPVSYRLPTEAPLPRTYRVTLAIVDAKNPDWIISQFACGVARTVTRENEGKFQEMWDGLDDNHMPVPPGEYGVKGIYMSAHEWPVDGEWHSVTPRFITGASSWMPPPDDWQTPEPFGGDPTNAPLGDVAVGPNGVAVFYYSYLENGRNNPMFDLNKPVGYGQFLRAFNSGGAGGGNATATDGETVWSFCNEGGMKYVYRADGKSFGKSPGAARSNSYLPEGWVTSMTAWKVGDKSYLAIAQRGKIVADGRKSHYTESNTEPVDKITFHDGGDGQVLAELPLLRPKSVTARDGILYALHADGAGFAVSSVALNGGVPKGKWQRVFAVPANITPFDMKADSRGNFYLSDEAANHVYQLSSDGRVLRTYGKLDEQKPGTYDPLTLMSPGKLATWTDAEGLDRLIVIENAGPNRASEWSADGRFLREYLTLQTKANDGYVMDPEDPTHVYVPGQQGWLTRFRVDFEKRTWAADAVWPLRDDPRARDLKKPRLLRANGSLFLAGAAGARENAFNVYRLDPEGWKLSAAILRLPSADPRKPAYFLWHDANGNGRVDDDELSPTELPGSLFTYHGQNWSEDFAFLAMNQGGRDVWSLAPSGFDAHGNPIFKEWKKLFTDPVFAARTEGSADAVHGGNELAESFSSDWMQTDGAATEGYYVQARGGKNFSANEAPQHKISRYVPDGHGSYILKWRTGRTALQWEAAPGEIYGAMRIRKPIGGLLSVIDQSRCGILLYNEEGLYVDTVFPDGKRFNQKVAGVYPQPGEFFVGDVVSDRKDGKIYFTMGKYTPMIFEAEGWSPTGNPVHPLPDVQRKVTIAASQIASPPEIALSLRGGTGVAKFARFAPALGEIARDGSMSGWESCEPVLFRADREQNVEVRCLYRPEELLLRWHARFAGKFEPKPLPPLPRLFTHDQLADTLSFYIQGDVNAKPGGSPEGRPGDARFVFGVFKNGAEVQPAGIGMYPAWSEKAKPSPQLYRTPVGTASFAHVGLVDGMHLSQRIDEDGKGFVLVASIPRGAIPDMRQPFTGGLRTLVNFEATFGGHNKFWWANSDGSASRETYDEPTEARLYPGSWAPIEFEGLESGVVIRNWLICGPFGGPGAEKFKADINGVMPGTNKEAKQAAREMCEAATYPPDAGIDLKARYTGDLVRGYWPDPHEVSWKPAAIAELDQRVVLGPSAQVWYGATWVYSPAEVAVHAEFHSHPQTQLRWFLNGEAVSPKPAEYQSLKDGKHLVASKSITLRAGWNQITFRGYCVGYPPFRAGLVLDGPASTLWNLKLSAAPPQ